jgi:hypothetical protein
MAIGDLITSTRYNNLQTRISTILGQGSGLNGYGQSVASAQKINGALITSNDYNHLTTDFLKAKQHQTGADETATYTTVTTSNIIQNSHLSIFENEIDGIETNKMIAGIGQLTLANVTSSVRTTDWTNQISHNITVDFTTANQGRYFFNSGGSIQLLASIVGGSPEGWDDLLSAVGVVNIGYNSTTTTGFGTGSAIGFYQLTNVPQTVFTINGTAMYAANTYSVSISCDVASNAAGTARYVYIAVQLNNAVASTVSGTTTSYVNVIHATGSNVSVSVPDVNTAQEL